MSLTIDFTPQPSYEDFFVDSAEEMIEHRTVFKQGYRYYVAYGGRGGAKTFSFSDACVIEGVLRPVRVLVTRELQNSIAESIKSEIEAAIFARGLEAFYRITKAEIDSPTGTKFIFRGLKNNINNLKSIADVDIVLCEESEAISKNSWDKLLPSIRPRSGIPPKVIVLFNPADELDDTYLRFVVDPPPQSIVKHLNWCDNIYFPPHLDEQRIHCMKTRPRKDYEHIWEGKPLGMNDLAIIDRDWVRAARDLEADTEGDIIVSYDPAGQGRDENAVVVVKGMTVIHVEEWVKSPDLREATYRALGIALDHDASIFRYDECGGFGDGVAVFVEDYLRDNKLKTLEIIPFNAGDKVLYPEKKIEGTEKTSEEMYANAKAQAHGVTAQLLYNSFRSAKLGEEIEKDDKIGIAIDDNNLFNKLVKELSAPLWVRSKMNSKKQVESKQDMEKRTNQPSPNLADAFHMCFAPIERSSFDAWLKYKAIT